MQIQRITKTWLAGLLMAMTLASAAHAEPGLMGHWKFDENSGTTVADASGNSLTGTLVNAPNWTAGKIGSALNFNGSNAYVNVGNPTALQFTGAMTITAWVRAETDTSYGRIVSKQGYSGNRGWSLSTEGGEISFQIARDASSVQELAIPNVFNQWIHIAAVYEPGVAMRLYLNGALSGQLTSGVAASQFNSSNNVNIGRRPDDCCYFDGQIDELRLYNRALTAAEVQAIYNSSSTADLVNPTAAVVSPANGANAAGQLTVSGTAADNVAVSKVEIRVDSGSFALASGTANWSFALDTLTLSNGAHTVTARATDSSGNTGSHTITINVNNDTAAPTLSVQAPANNATVSQTVTVSGTAADNAALSKVEIKVDNGAYSLAAGLANWSYALDTQSLANGAHTITARATDASGNAATQIVNVTVNNSQPVSSVGKLIHVQGKLTDAAGNPITGARIVTFRLYASSAAGAALWSDTIGLNLASGLFNVALGQNQPLDPVAFDRALYVGFQMAGDSEMIPRQPLGSSAYALGSVGDFNAGKSVLIKEKLGVGTQAPSEKLQVEGNALINGTIRGATLGFGGLYSLDTCGTNSRNNHFTGATQCPSGFQSVAAARLPASGTGCTTDLYVCVK